MKRTIVILLLLLSPALVLRAQEDFEEDSVLVSGRVVNRMTGLPEAYTIVRLMQEGQLQAAAWCDSAGYFDDLLLPVGGYRLEVQVRGVTLYQADLLLRQDADLSIAVITDSIRLVKLREVRVTALRHKLGPLQIASKKDTRLWDFSYRDSPWEIKRDGNAAVAEPVAMHRLYGDFICEGQSGCCRPSKYYYMFFMQSYGLEVSSYNSEMKNELLRYGRILDVKYPAPADTAEVKE